MRILRGETSKNVILLMTGTVLGQAIPIAIMPVLTRMYSPEQFGTYATFLAIAAILSVVAAARYELAIMQPKEDRDAADLVGLSIFISFCSSLITLVAIVLLRPWIDDLLENQKIGSGIYLIPLSVLFFGCYQALTHWSNRRKNYKRMSATRVVQGVSMASSQVAGGYAGASGGLMIGQVVGQFLSFLAILFSIRKNERADFKNVSLKGMQTQARKFIQFPKFSVIGALLDNVGLQAPIFLLGYYFSSQITGFFSLTFRSLNLPMAVIGTALSQVLFQRFVSLRREQPESLPGFVQKIFWGLLAFMVPFVLIMFFFGEPIFALIFGETWREAGRYAGILSVAVAIRFAVSPLSSILAMEHNVKLGMLWQALYCVTITSTLYLSRNLEIERVFMFFAAHEVVLYLIYFYLIQLGTKRS